MGKRLRHPCPVCGAVVVQVYGRRRVYCSDSCKLKAYRRRLAKGFVTPIEKRSAQWRHRPVVQKRLKLERRRAARRDELS